jgi:PPOX class probable F420-dependent enzyme
MPITFDDATRRLLDGKNFATLSTIGPNGAPQSSVIWVQREGDTLLFSTTTQRQKARNLARDPRLSLSIFDIADPYEYVEIRGKAELIDDPDKTFRAGLSQRYLGEDPPPEPPELRRVIVRVMPEKVNHVSV